MKRPTRNDVAHLAGVSGCTVSYVLNDRKDIAIKEETRQRVFDACQKLGYQKNFLARALVTGKTNLISLWVESFRPYYGSLINNIRTCASENGYALIITDFDDMSSTNKAPFWSVDGIIAIEAPELVAERLKSCPDPSVPFVNLGGWHLDYTDYVGVDLYAGACVALEHLMSIGCGNIAYAGLPYDDDPRRSAYNDFMARNVMKPAYLSMAQTHRSVARSMVRDYVENGGRPDAILCQNDDTAIGVYRGLCDLGLKVPEDVAIIGCDGIEDTEYMECPIATIEQPAKEMCRLAWDFLMARISDREVSRQQVVLKPKLVVRRSCQPASRA